jgi:hypothetical protein
MEGHQEGTAKGHNPKKLGTFVTTYGLLSILHRFSIALYSTSVCILARRLQLFCPNNSCAHSSRLFELASAWAVVPC